MLIFYLVVISIKVLQVHNLQDDEYIRISMMKEVIYQDDLEAMKCSPML